MTEEVDIANYKEAITMLNRMENLSKRFGELTPELVTSTDPLGFGGPNHHPAAEIIRMIQMCKQGVWGLYGRESMAASDELEQWFESDSSS